MYGYLVNRCIRFPYSAVNPERWSSSIKPEMLSPILFSLVLVLLSRLRWAPRHTIGCRKEERLLTKAEQSCILCFILFIGPSIHFEVIKGVFQIIFINISCLYSTIRLRSGRSLSLSFNEAQTIN